MAPRGAVGGTINLVPKRAPTKASRSSPARYLSDAQFGGRSISDAGSDPTRASACG
jgi:outer membrane receptor protein involved in Fe transport